MQIKRMKRGEKDMDNSMKKIGGILVVTALAALISVSAYAQGPDGITGTPLSGIFPHTMPGGAIGPAAWDNNGGPDALVGGLIGGFLGYMIENNQYRDQDRYYSDRDRERQRDRDRDRRYYDSDRRRYEDRRWSRYDPDCRYDSTSWDRYPNRYRDRNPRWHPR
jgi:hypothetical protein